MTLTAFLKLPGAVSAFRSYLQSEYADESLAFLQCVEEYRQSEQKSRLARSIFEQFVRNDAPREINISGQSRQAIERAVREGLYEEDLYDRARKELILMLEYDSYVRFMQSEEYRTWKRQAEAPLEVLVE